MGASNVDSDTPQIIKIQFWQTQIYSNFGKKYIV